MPSASELSNPAGLNLCAALTPAANAGRATGEAGKLDFVGILSLLAGFGNASEQNPEGQEKSTASSESAQAKDTQDDAIPRARARRHAESLRPGASSKGVTGVETAMAAVLMAPLPEPARKIRETPQLDDATAPPPAASENSIAHTALRTILTNSQLDNGLGHAEGLPAIPVAGAMEEAARVAPAPNIPPVEGDDVGSLERLQTVPLEPTTGETAAPLVRVDSASGPQPVQIAFTARLTPLVAEHHPDALSTHAVMPPQEPAAEQQAANTPPDRTDDRPADDSEHARPRAVKAVTEPAATAPERNPGQGVQTLMTPASEPRPQQAHVNDDNFPVRTPDEPRSVYQSQETALPATPPAGPIRTLDFQLESNLGRVAMRVADRAGELKVDVRTADPSLSGALRSGLPELTARMEQAGFHAETWHPGLVAASERKSGTEPAASVRTSSDQPPRDNGQRQDDSRNPAQQPQPAPRKQNRKEFQWLFTSIR